MKYELVSPVPLVVPSVAQVAAAVDATADVAVAGSTAGAVVVSAAEQLVGQLLDPWPAPARQTSWSFPSPFSHQALSTPH